MGNNGLIIKLTKRTARLAFGQILNTYNGFVSGVQFLPLRIQTATNVMDNSEIMLEINMLHKSLGHCGEGTLRTEPRVYEWKLYEVCKDCTIEKANKIFLQISVSRKQDSRRETFSTVRYRNNTMINYNLF